VTYQQKGYSMNRALITGLGGQDGSYLAELLLDLDYEVHGIIRRQSTPENQSTRYEHINEKVTTHYGDLLDEHSLYRIMRDVRPTHIFNLAAMSHVRISFDVPSFTIQTNALGVLNMLEATRNLAPQAKFYQASSSEMFGNSVDEDNHQRLTTPMNPVSPYGCAKVLGYNIANHYRNAYKMFVVNGILFNHESPRRGSNFVTNKVVKRAVEISLDKADKLVLGNLDSKRDWGHSKDYMKAIIKMMDYKEARNWVIATGKSHSVRDLVTYVFEKLNLDPNKYVTQNPKFMRPEELKYLCGDSSETRKILKWKPEYTFETMLDEMIERWQNHLS
tara:strand:- start:16 stop:1011 length:996 start_codon:yes stop_codon:yes gene_type:complete